jgi:hypothetical protein
MNRIFPFILLPLVSICSTAQISEKTYHEKFPEHLHFSADTISEILIYVMINKKVESDYDTVIRLKNTDIKSFIADLNKNDLLPATTYFDQHYENKVLNRHIKKTGTPSYSIELISSKNNKTGFYIYKDLIGITVGDSSEMYMMFSTTGQLGLFYELSVNNILKKYKVIK